MSGVRNEPYPVIVRARNALSASDTFFVRLSPNLVENPSFEDPIVGWNASQPPQVERVSPGRTDDYAMRVTSASGPGTFGVTDSPDWVASLGVGTIYRFSAWVRSLQGAGPVWLWVREYENGVPINNETSPRAPISSEWTNLNQTYYSRGSHSSVDCLVMMLANQAGDQFDVDDVSIFAEQVPPLAVPPSARPGVQQLVSPNPMRAAASLRLDISRPGRLRAKILDLSGRVVRVLADEASAPAGMRSWTLRARDGNGAAWAPGVYFYRIEAADGVRSGRFVVLQ
jgi:hypothetical protein